MISLSCLKESDIPAFQTFIHEHWKAGHIFSKEESIFRWQHMRPGDKEAHYCIAKDGDEIVGIQGVIPTSLFDPELGSDQIFLSLWKALEDRGVAIGLSLYRTILKRYSPNFIGVVGIRSNVLPFYEINGFKIGELDHYVMLSEEVSSFSVAEVPKSVQNSTVSGEDVIKPYEWGQANPDWFSHQLPQKSEQYLRGRYEQHPVYNYHLWSVGDEGVLVGRFVSVNGGKVLRLIDVIGPDSMMRHVGPGLQRVMKESWAEYVDLYVTGLNKEDLLAGGFIDRKETEGLVVPNYFEPFEKRNIDVMFAHKADSEIPVRLCKGDGDQDRPNSVS